MVAWRKTIGTQVYIDEQCVDEVADELARIRVSPGEQASDGIKQIDGGSAFHRQAGIGLPLRHHLDAVKAGTGRGSS